MSTTRICPQGLVYRPTRPPTALVDRLRDVRARQADAYAAMTGTRLGLAALATALLEEHLDRRGWRNRVVPDNRLDTARRQNARATLALMVPVDLVTRLDAASATHSAWTRVGVIEAVLTVALDRLESAEARAAAGDRRAARSIEHLLLSTRRDLRVRGAAAAEVAAAA